MGKRPIWTTECTKYKNINSNSKTVENKTGAKPKATPTWFQVKIQNLHKIIMEDSESSDSRSKSEDSEMVLTLTEMVMLYYNLN